jgi:hypothetical protein
MTKKRPWLLLLAAFLLMPLSTVQAQNSHVGETPFAFLNNDYDARTMAMGGASLALPNDLIGVFANPAAAGFISQREVMCGMRSIIQDVFGGSLGYAMPFSNFGTFCINFVPLSYGSIQEVDEGQSSVPVYTNTYWSAYSVAGQLSWSKIVWDQLSLGVAVRGIYEREGSPAEGYSWNAACVQAGVQYRLNDSRLILAMAVSNAGFMVSSLENDLKLPLALSVGISYVPYYIPTVRIALDLQQTADANLMYKPGLEVALYRKYFFGRFGYRFSETDLEELFKQLQGQPSDGYQKTTWYGPSFGVGLVTDAGDRYTINVDAAIQLLDNADPAPCLSLMVKF